MEFFVDAFVKLSWFLWAFLKNFEGVGSLKILMLEVLPLIVLE